MVYVYSGADGTVLHAVSPLAPAEDGYFGYSGVGVGNADGNGTPGLLLGTRVPASDFEQAERAHLFNARGDRLRTFAAPGVGTESWFGSVGATVTTEEGDAATAVLVGAPRADVDGASDAGRVYLFALP